MSQRREREYTARQNGRGQMGETNLVVRRRKRAKDKGRRSGRLFMSVGSGQRGKRKRGRRPGTKCLRAQGRHWSSVRFQSYSHRSESVTCALNPRPTRPHSSRTAATSSLAHSLARCYHCTRAQRVERSGGGDDNEQGHVHGAAKQRAE